MEITVTTWADAPGQKNVEQEQRLTAGARAHVAIHLGKGIYLHLDVSGGGIYTLTTGDYRAENTWLKTDVAEGNVFTQLAEAVGARSETRAMYIRLYNRIMNSHEFDLGFGDELIMMLMLWAQENHVAGPEWGGGMRMTTDQKRAEEWREEQQQQS